VILKWAKTQDGYISPKHKKKNQPVWISNSISRTLAHQWRAEEQSILIGSQTAVDDNPSLTTRRIDGPSPTRILIDPNEKINRNAKLFAADQKVIVYTNNHSRIDEHIYYVSIDFSGNGLKQILSDLHLKNIQSVLVEGGAKTLQYFIDAGMWDEAKVFTGQGTFGDGVLAPDTSSFTNAPVSVAELNGDVLEVWVNLNKHQ